jgi:hypothetical protein
MRAVIHKIDGDVEAIRWFKNGDYIEDDSRIIFDFELMATFLSEGKVVRRYRNPGVKGEVKCKKCGYYMYDHGWIDEYTGKTVCPGDWIIKDKYNGDYCILSDEEFVELYGNMCVGMENYPDE